MTRGQALTHLIRMRDMKRQRLDNYRGSEQSSSYLRADVAALNYAIDLIEVVQEGVLSREARRAAS